MKLKSIRLAYLYPNEMNTYGDWGNVLCLQQRMAWRGYKLNIIEHHPRAKLPEKIDLVFMGGGQDSGQAVIETDFNRIGPWLTKLVQDGVPMLTICGAYQLFGHSFQMVDGRKLPGIGIFDLSTEATTDRLIGNISVETAGFGELIGFENHSGRTFLNDPRQTLGRVISGNGNNGQDGTEGILVERAIGTYLHGPILPKNPILADWLLATALGISVAELEPINEEFVVQARKIAQSRP